MELTENTTMALIILSCIPAFGFLFGKLPKIPQKYHSLCRLIGGLWLLVAAFLIALL